MTHPAVRLAQLLAELDAEGLTVSHHRYHRRALMKFNLPTPEDAERVAWFADRHGMPVTNLDGRQVAITIPDAMRAELEREQRAIAAARPALPAPQTELENP